MKEAEVVKRVHRFLKRSTLQDRQVARLYTDAHHTLLPNKELRPFQRFTLDLGDYAVHPDLVGQLNDGETLLAVEAKGNGDITRGLAQAQQYQEGFHLSLLASNASAIGSSVERFARRESIGLLAVTGEVQVIYWPRPRQPWRDPARSIRRQMEAVGQVSGPNTFQYNLPTHYFAWTVALSPGAWYERDELSDQVEAYPMPKDWLGALRGARKLGLVDEGGGSVRLTTTGKAVKDILDTSLEAWAAVHQKSKRTPLVDHEPRAAAVLRLLVMQDPMARLLEAGLKQTSGQRASFDELARTCDQLDHARAPVLFFVPERIERITDKRGHIQWGQVEGHHFRSRTFYQHKSILKHAGVIADTGLGSATAKDYDPKEDIWALR